MPTTALYSSEPSVTRKRIVASRPFFSSDAQKRRSERGSKPRKVSCVRRASDVNAAHDAGKANGGRSASSASMSRGRQSSCISDAGMCLSPLRFRMPPFSTERTSRVRFLDLDPLLPELRREGTLFMPEAVELKRTGIYNFDDAPYIEKVVFGKYGCPETTSSFRTNMSRATVNYDVDPRLPDCAMVAPEHGAVMMNMNEGCGPSVLPREEVYHFEWEPRCLMLVLSAENERQYLDEAMRAGRLLSDPL